jgi:hypothetical protein
MMLMGDKQYIRSENEDMIDAWEDKLAKVLKASRFEIFHGLEDLRIEINSALLFINAEKATTIKA